MSDKAAVKIQIKFDDDFRTLTDDVARIWFTVGDAPGNTASIAVMVRSVGHGSPVQLGMHERARRVVREALEKEFAPGSQFPLLTERIET